MCERDAEINCRIGHNVALLARIFQFHDICQGDLILQFYDIDVPELKQGAAIENKFPGKSRLACDAVVPTAPQSAMPPRRRPIATNKPRLQGYFAAVWPRRPPPSGENSD
jgi:hypothetical protein